MKSSEHVSQHRTFADQGVRKFEFCLWSLSPREPGSLPLLRLSSFSRVLLPVQARPASRPTGVVRNARSVAKPTTPTSDIKHAQTKCCCWQRRTPQLASTIAHAGEKRRALRNLNVGRNRTPGRPQAPESRSMFQKLTGSTAKYLVNTPLPRKATFCIFQSA